MAVFGSNFAYGSSPFYIDEGITPVTGDYGSYYDYGESPVFKDDDSTIVVPTSATINTLIDTIFMDGLNPTVIVSSRINMDFVGVPQIGSSPLVVNFSATTNLQGGADGSYLISAYDWYFDNDAFPTTYEETTVPYVTHIYKGYAGKRYSVKLIGKITHTT